MPNPTINSNKATRISCAAKVLCSLACGLLVTLYQKTSNSLLEERKLMEFSLRSNEDALLKNNLQQQETTSTNKYRLHDNLLTSRAFHADAIWSMLLQEGSAMMQQLDPTQTIGTAMEVGMHRPKQCLEAAKAGLEVHCIEPSPASFQRVQDGVRQALPDIAKRVHLYQAAAADTTGHLVPFTATGGTGDHVGHVDAWNMKPIQDSSEATVGKTIEVPTIRLDDIISTTQKPVYALKVDTQGFEPAVFAGLSQSLQSHQVSYILLEYWPRGMDLLAGTPNQCIAVHVLEQLVDAGYTLYALPVVAHPKAPSGYKTVIHERPLNDLRQNCQWYLDLEQQFPSEEYKMGYWSDVLAVAPNAPSLHHQDYQSVTKLGTSLLQS